MRVAHAPEEGAMLGLSSGLIVALLGALSFEAADAPVLRGKPAVLVLPGR